MKDLKQPGVYIIRNTIDSDTYVGSSVNIAKRWKQHLSRLSQNRHWVKGLQSIYNKYGVDSIYLEVIEFCVSDALRDNEQYWLDVLSPKYNVCKNSKNTEGRICSDETKKKIGAANSGNSYWAGRKHKEESKIKIGVASKGRIGYWRGKKMPDEARKKLSESCKGRVGAMLGKKHTEEAKKKMGQHSLRLLLNTQTGIYYEGIRDAAFSIGMPVKTMYNRMCGVRKNNTSFIYV